MNRGTDAGLGETPKRKTKKVCLARMSEAWLVNMSALFIEFCKTTHDESQGCKYEMRGRDLSMSKIWSLPQRKKKFRKDTDMQIVILQCE